jgi:hypothetical protein
MKVIQITEENHGHIGTAASMKAAYQFLVKKGWLGFWDDIRVGDNLMSIGDFFDERGWEKTNENLVFWAWTRTEPEDWDGMFYFDASELIEED